jgi:hypothetical protein
VSIRKLLPSLDENSATVELGDVLNVIGRQLKGTEFYANGNPVVARLALQERTRQLIAILQQGDAPPPVDTPPPGNEPPLGDAPPPVHRTPVKAAAQSDDEEAASRPRRGQK